ncbi:MAG TPA: hypothetical protein PLV08_00485, partial [Flavobacteriales bacterium]|nr:hypothetical protein [Flavobacteriales bacterium]
MNFMQRIDHDPSKCWITNLSVKVFSPAVMLTRYRPLAIAWTSIAEFTKPSATATQRAVTSPPVLGP